jgi:hypothetical protein
MDWVWGICDMKMEVNLAILQLAIAEGHQALSSVDKTSNYTA